MESLGESNADQLVEITGQGAPARVLVVAQAEQVDIPKQPSQLGPSSPSSTNPLFIGRCFSDKHFTVI